MRSQNVSPVISYIDHREIEYYVAYGRKLRSRKAWELLKQAVGIMSGWKFSTTGNNTGSLVIE